MNRYKPEEILTREDMAVLAYKAIKAAGVQLPEVKEYKEFDDNSQISDYAKEAVKAMQLAGILEGTGKNRFLPKNNSAN